MDQIKIGRFIAERRRAMSLTQMQLAEKLNITDRAVSKWETGRSMPDSSVMLELCEILGITANDLLCGEVVSVDNYNKTMEENLIDMIKQKEESDKRLLRIEIAMGLCCALPVIAAIIISLVTSMEEWKKVVMIFGCMVPFVIAAVFALRIEQKAGYYECQLCAHRYVPKYISVFLAPHVNRTRYMRCPSCGKHSWQKKVLSKGKTENN